MNKNIEARKSELFEICKDYVSTCGTWYNGNSLLEAYHNNEWCKVNHDDCYAILTLLVQYYAHQYFGAVLILGAAVISECL